MKKNNYQSKKVTRTKVLFAYFSLFILSIIGVSQSFAQSVSQVFNYTTAGAQQTFTVPVGVTSITIGCWGGGGGAGGATNNPFSGNEAASGGGGGGAYAESTLTGLVSGTTYTVIVGGGGTAGAAGNHNGGNGGTSSFGGTTVVAVGGGGSLAGNNGNSGGAGGAGGLASACTGTIVFSGGAGAASSVGIDGGGGGGAAGNGGDGSVGAVPAGGAGGIGTVTGLPSSPGGAGGAGVYNIATSNSGVMIGGGGGGNDAYATGFSTKNVAGSAGANGEVIISYIAPAPVITSLAGNGCVGTSITITGTNLIGANPITIGGTPVASVTSISSTQIVAVIAPGSSGIVSVTTPSGTATSSGSFTVNPAPAVPGNPISNSPQCTSPGPGVTIARTGAPPAGISWYWETTPTGTSTANSGGTYNVTTSGTYYIVAQNNTTGCWSLGTGSTSVIVNTLPTAAVTPSPTAGATGVCYGGSGASDLLSWAAVTNATSYDVYFGTGSVPATVTATVPSNSYPTGTLLPSTTYFWQVVPKNSCGVPTASPTIWSFTTGAALCYCASSGSTTGDGILKVTFNTINNTSASNTRYTDYTASVSTTVNSGSSYPLSVFVNTNSSGTNTYTNSQRAWIDWNQNGVFDIPSEQYNLGTVYTSNNANSSLCPFNITVPAGAMIGSTRMRIISIYGSAYASTACQTGFDGETEDYTVVVATPAAPTISSFAPSTACPGTSITINGTNLYGITPSQVTIGGIPVSSITSTTGTVLVAVLGYGASGNFPVVVTTSGGTASSSTNITINPSPTLMVTPGSTQFCNPGAGVSITASGTSTSYAWQPSGAGLSALTGATVTASPTATTTYTITGTDGSGCTSTATTTITSAPSTSVTISPAVPPTLCLGNVQPLTLTSTNGNVTFFNENFNNFSNGFAKTGGSASTAWTLEPDGYQYTYTPGIFSNPTTITFHSNDNSQFYLTNAIPQGLGNVTTSLITPSINTTGYSNIVLKFYHYLAWSSGTANVDISNNGGTTWTTLQSFVSNQGAVNSFAAVSINLNTYVNQSILVRFIFTSSPPLFGGADWWAVDNVSISGLPNVNFSWSPTATLYDDASATAGYTATNSLGTAIYAKPTTATTYTVNATNGYCSSSNSVSINVGPVLTGSQTLSGCAGFSVTVGSNVHNSTGVYIDTIPAFGGGTCDSVVTTNLTVGSTVTPGPISGSTTVCSSTNQIYYISPVAGATSYTWTLPGTWTGTSTSDSITATIGTSAGTISVTANTSCGSSPAQNLSTSLSASLPTPGPISGNTTVCGGTPQTYYIAAVSGATSYTWTLPGTWSGTSTTDSISPTIGTAGGTISVVANGGCGTSASQTLTIGFGNPPAQPSPILGVHTLCDSSSTAYAVTNDLSATSYTWTLPSGWSGISDSCVITATASNTTGLITVTANNGCGSSAPATVNVTGSTIPVITVPSFGIACLNSGTVALTGATPAGGTYSGTGVNSNVFDPLVPGIGTYYITYTYSSGACVRSDSATIIVDLCIGIATNSNNNNITIYPNPTNGIITIEIANTNSSELIISVSDIQGREVYNSIDKNIVTGYSKQISLEHLAKGIYYIKLQNGEHSSYQKLIIE